MLGFIAGLLVALHEARRRGFSADHVLNFSVWALLGALVGARVMYVLLDLPTYLQNPVSILQLDLGGMSIHGALIGGAVVALIFVRRHSLSYWRLADIVAPGLILGQAIGRIGCFLNGDSYGRLTGVPWGFEFSAAGVPGVRHPTQLYEMALNFVIFGILWLVFRRRQKFDGQILLLYLILYSVGRSVVEIFRESEMLFGPVTIAQGASLLIAGVAVALWPVLRRRGMAKTASMDLPGGRGAARAAFKAGN